MRRTDIADILDWELEEDNRMDLVDDIVRNAGGVK